MAASRVVAVPCEHDEKKASMAQCCRPVLRLLLNYAAKFQATSIFIDPSEFRRCVLNMT